MLSDLVIPRILEGLSLSAQDIRATLRPFLRRDACPSFLKRVREAASARVTDENHNVVSRLPDYIEALNNLGHKAKLLTKKKQEMLDTTVGIAREQHRKYPSTVPFDEAAFRDSLGSTVPSDALFFYGALYVPVSAVAMVSKLVPVFTADAAHCASVTKGTLFSLYGSDVSHRQVLLALMLVADNESESTWRLFLEFVKDHLDLDREHFRMITDQDKGCRAAIAAILPQVKQFYCCMHRQGNIYKRADAISGKSFGSAIHSWTSGQLAAATSRYTAKGSEYISKVGDAEQYPFVRGGLYGLSTTQGVESMNRANMSVRMSPIGGAFLRAVALDQSRHVNACSAQDAHKDSGAALVPRVKSLLEVVQAKASSRRLPVTFLDVERKKARVLSERNPLLWYTVNLHDKSCTCGKWQGTTFPCVHAACIFLQGEQNIQEYLARYDSSFWYALQYDNVTEYSIPCTITLFESGVATDLRLPLAIPPKSGRPRKRRRISSLETSAARIRRCSRCGSRRHNVRTCQRAVGAVV